MVTIAYILLFLVIFIWVLALILVIREYKESKSDWDKYWDQVYRENNLYSKTKK